MVLISTSRVTSPAARPLPAATPRAPVPRSTSTPQPPPDFEPYDPPWQPAPGGTEHEITLHATETVVEVAPGVEQEVWTFNDTVPGPVLRGKVGDIFTVTLVNDGKLGHSIDFHASKVAWNDEMRTIEPGESARVPVRGQARRDLDVPLRHGAGAAPHRQRHVRRHHHRPARPTRRRPRVHLRAVRVLPRAAGPAGRPGQDAGRAARRRRLQRVRQPVLPPPDPGGDRRADPGMGARRRSERELVVPHRRHDLRHRVQGGRLPAPARRRRGRLTGARPATSAGWVRRVHLRRGRPLPVVTHKFANVGKGALGVFQVGDVEAPSGGH